MSLVIEVKEVWRVYQSKTGTEVAALRGVNLSVEQGAFIALKGRSGSGKTTLVNLIMRFYELDGGRITIDGRDITTFARRELRSRIGMVLQDTWLFRGTIADNIAYGRPGATHDEVRAAARAAHVDRFVGALPDGYDTVVDDEGGTVSAGEKQLLTIARAFLADPAILIPLFEKALAAHPESPELLGEVSDQILKETRVFMGNLVDVQDFLAKVLKVDADNNLLLVEGAVPGGPNSVVVIRKAVAAKAVKVAQALQKELGLEPMAQPFADELSKLLPPPCLNLPTIWQLG